MIVRGNIREMLRRYPVVAAFALGTGAGVLFMSVSMMLVSLAHTFPPQYDFEVVSTTHTSELSASAPVRLRVPSVGIDAAFEEPLGLSGDQTVEVPGSIESVGWYEYSPTPGEIGPSVVFGHVDSKEGPGVFFTLRHAKVGDEIYIEREDGSTAVFEVTGLGYAPQDTFPTERVYGDLNYPGLRLVTCGGRYNKEETRYSHNLIVYAVLKEES